MAKRTKKLIENEQIDDDTRINKYLSDAGVCSRREADKYISDGKITIDGVTAVMGSRVKAGQVVLLEGKPVSKDESLALIAFNKPRGIVCTTDKREKNNIIDFIQYNKRIYPIGRLDKESEGLILLTNDGNIVNKILRAGNNHEKEYVVTVNKVISAEFLKGMAEGVPILDTITRPCEVKALDKVTFQIILTQGLNRQIRRMCEYFDYKVLTLKRTRIMNINLGYMQVGGYRNVTEREIAGLNELISNSINTPESLWNSMEDASDEVLDKDNKEHQTKPAYNKYKTSYKKEGPRKEGPKKEGYKKGWHKKEWQRKEGQSKEAPDYDTPRKEVTGKDTSRKDSPRNDGARKETSEQGSQRRDIIRKEASREDFSRNGGARKETSGQGPQRRDIMRKDYSRNDGARKETSGQGSQRRDIIRKDASRKDFSRNDGVRKDSSGQGSQRKEFTRKDSFKYDTYKKGTSKKEGSGKSEPGKNTFRKDISEKDISRKDTPQKDVFNKDMPKRDKTTKDVYKTEFKKKNNIKGNTSNKAFTKTDDKKDKLRVSSYSNKSQNKNYNRSERSSSRGRKG